MKMTKKLRNKKGFTLIELIVVIAILGILAAIAVPRLTGFTEKARISADKSTYDTISRSISIGVANESITSDVTITSSGDGVITSTATDLIEAGASFKVTLNKSKTMVWDVAADGKVTAPAINLESGVIGS